MSASDLLGHVHARRVVHCRGDVAADRRVAHRILRPLPEADDTTGGCRVRSYAVVTRSILVATWRTSTIDGKSVAFSQQTLTVIGIIATTGKSDEVDHRPKLSGYSFAEDRHEPTCRVHGGPFRLRTYFAVHHRGCRGYRLGGSDGDWPAVADFHQI